MVPGMRTDPAARYQPYGVVPLVDRRWPDRRIRHAPLWCSVDLRDGNQALIDPMNAAQKRVFFDTLVALGFKEIEIGFPAASRADFDFCRMLIDEHRIPEDVTVQVLVQAREHLIEKTFDALRGVRRAIVHLYNSTSAVQRELVFRTDKEGVKAIAVKGARLVRQHASRHLGTEWVFQYSPESFTATEVDYAVEVCDAVIDVWQPTPERKAIVNLPATVELSTPNLYADLIEWVDRHIAARDRVVLSVHPHNDRGTAVAAAELALMAGAERVEGTLFGNGERTGNVDLVTLALNMYSQGVDPALDLSDIAAVVEAAERCTQLPVHPRHPYAGALVFTAFSGSHQDAIRKGLAAQAATGPWRVPYLPIDPGDIGRQYEPIIRVNSQSGKGGIAFVLERDRGIALPYDLQIEFSRLVQDIGDRTGREVTTGQIWDAFKAEYLDAAGPFAVGTVKQPVTPDAGDVEAVISRDGIDYRIGGGGARPLQEFVDALSETCAVGVSLVSCEEQAIGNGAQPATVALVVLDTLHGERVFGAGLHACRITAGLSAVVSALNRSIRLAAADV
jgi:2-isopropylmalate synthase